MVFKIDGIDGCGKSTLIQNIFNKLSQSHSTIVIEEFGTIEDYHIHYQKCTHSISELLRSIALERKIEIDDLERQLLLSILSRRVNKVIIPKLKKEYDIILVDRSELSNYAYGSIIDEQFNIIYSSLLSSSKPNGLIFWLDTPIDVCLGRLRKKEKDAVEIKGTEYLKGVENKFQNLYTSNKDIIRIDGCLPLHKQSDMVLDKIFGKLKNHFAKTANKKMHPNAPCNGNTK